MILEPIKKKDEIITGIKVFHIWQMNSYSKENKGKKSFSYETQALKPCIPIRIMCLWCPITKRIEIVMTIQFVPFDGRTLISKENDGKKSISCQTKASKIVYLN